MSRRIALLFCVAAAAYAALPPGYPLPDVPITRINAPKIDLKKYRGKALVLALISTECDTCGLTVDFLNTMQEEDGPKGLQIVAAAGDENAGANLFYFERQHRPKFPIGYLDQPAFIKIASLLPAEHPFVPILMFIDAKGMVRVKIKGDDPLMKKREATIRSTIRELLKEPGIKP